MDNLEKPAPANDELSQLQAQCDSLRHLVVSVLVLLVVVSGTLTIFLWRQVKNSQLELENMRPQVGLMMAEYQKTVGPIMDDFVRKLADYGKAHADFNPILGKYIRVGPPASPGPVAPPAAAKK